MPQMDDIPFYKKDGTTLSKWVAKTPASGDSTAAQWRVDDASPIALGRPSLTMAARFNANKSARRMTIDFVQPELATNTVTGAVSVSTKCMSSHSFLLPENVSDARKEDFVDNVLKTLTADLVKACILAGYSAT